jgi:hypothetical protein
MNKPGEFSVKTKTDYLRGSAVKMLANLIQKPGDREAREIEVVVSNTYEASSCQEAITYFRSRFLSTTD